MLGGAGYTNDHPVEMFYRDNRLNPIHEGTTGISELPQIEAWSKLLMALDSTSYEMRPDWF